jgi:hypothetical protein
MTFSLNLADIMEVIKCHLKTRKNGMNITGIIGDGGGGGNG